MTEEAPQMDEGQAQEAPEAEAGQGSENQRPWYGDAPDEIKGYIQNKGWTEDPLKAVTSYQALEKFQGANEDQLLKLPKDMSEEGALDPVYDKLGRPESPDKYEIDLGDDVPEIDENRLGQFKEVAHKLGLNNKQVNELAKMDAQYANQYMEQYQEQKAQQQQAEINKLENEWGENFEERAELGRRFIRQNLPDSVEDKSEMLNAIEDAIGPYAMLKLFANAGEKGMSKEDRVPDSGGDRPFGYTKEQAIADRKALMSELNADPDRLANYNQGKGPDYDKMKRLLEIASS